MYDLSKIPIDVLQAELLRRTSLVNKNYYVFLDDDSEDLEEGFIEVWIVHKRFYHMEHCINSVHLNRMIKVPAGFYENQESHFKYEGSLAAARRLLELSGFTWLDQPYLNGHHTHVLNQKFYVSVNSDTPDIFERFKVWADKHKDFSSLSDYKTALQVWGEQFGYAAFTFNEYSNSSCYAAIMERSVYESLPT